LSSLCFLTAYCMAKRRILLFANGLIDQGVFRSVGGTWDEVVEVRKAECPEGMGLSLRFADGKSITLYAEEFPECPAISQVVGREVSERLAPRLFKEYKQGEELAFGKFRVSLQGLSWSGLGSTIPWREVQGVRVGREDTLVSVVRNGATLATGIPSFQVPNLEVLLKIVEFEATGSKGNP